MYRTEIDRISVQLYYIKFHRWKKANQTAKKRQLLRAILGLNINKEQSLNSGDAEQR